jgi:hypothetical protein
MHPTILLFLILNASTTAPTFMAMIAIAISSAHQQKVSKLGFRQSYLLENTRRAQ